MSDFIKAKDLTDEQIDAMPQTDNHKRFLRILRATNQVTDKPNWTKDEMLKRIKEANDAR